MRNEFEDLKKGLDTQMERLQGAVNLAFNGLSAEDLEKVQPLQTEFNNELRKAKKKLNKLNKKYADLNRNR